MALTTTRLTDRLETTQGRTRALPMKGATMAHQGGIAVLESEGVVAPGRAALDLTALGVFAASADNEAGAAGALRVEVEAGGAYGFDNSAGADEVTRADRVAYVVDDHTVAKTDGGGTRSGLVSVHDVKDGQVFVVFDNPTP